MADGKIFTYIHTDEFHSIEEEKQNEMYMKLSKLAGTENESNLEKMFIMADVECELLLISMIWLIAEKTLIIYPDFIDIENYYTKEINMDTKLIYHFAVENLMKVQEVSFKNTDDDKSIMKQVKYL